MLLLHGKTRQLQVGVGVRRNAANQERPTILTGRRLGKKLASSVENSDGKRGGEQQLRP
jgi:hypothetical protein